MTEYSPLLLGSSSSSSFKFPPVFHSPHLERLNSRPALPELRITIQNYSALEDLYRSLADVKENRFRYFTALHIHLEEFKRPIFQVIEENEFDIQSETSSSHMIESSSPRKWRNFKDRLPSIIHTSREQKAAYMISNILKRMPYLETLEIMLFNKLKKIDITCSSLVKLVVSAGYFDEFGWFWKSCHALKEVTLDGIIPRTNPKEVHSKEYVSGLGFLETRDLVYLNVTHNTILTNMEFILLLKAINTSPPGVSKLHYEVFSNHISRLPSMEHLMSRIMDGEEFVSHLHEARNLKILSFKDDESGKIGILKGLAGSVKRNLQSLFTTSRTCPLELLSEFSALRELTLWWKDSILPKSFLDPQAMIGNVLDLNFFPDTLQTFNLCLSPETIKKEILDLANFEGLALGPAEHVYSDILSTILDRLVIRFRERNIRLKVWINGKSHILLQHVIENMMPGGPENDSSDES